MKQYKWMCILSILLISCMIVQPVSAAGRNRGGNRGNSRWEWFDTRKEEKKESGSKEESTSSGDSAAVMTLVEDETTVENGDMLRASTYSLMTADETGTAEDTTSTTVKYFPVTMYDYDEDVINDATDALDNDLTLREGLYFSGGNPAYTRSELEEAVVEYKVSDDQVMIDDGTYILYCTDTSYYVTNSVNTSSYWETTVLNGTGANDKNSATQWKFTRQEDGTYTIQDATGAYLTITGRNSANLTTEKNTVSLFVQNADDYTVVIYDDAGGDNGYMNSLGADYYGTGYFGGYVSGSTFSICTLTGEKEIISGYEAWNRWDKASGNNANGDLIYTGLAGDTLVDDQIVFNVNEGGIFNDDTTVKDIYEYVGLPFVLEDGFYTFDSDKNGVYFADTDSDGDADPQSGTETSAYNLQFDEGTPQAIPTGESVGDGSTNAWFPYNIYSSASNAYNQDINYHFGMRADIPFSMTANGRVKSTDDTSKPITFTFSGDDDVWVYIDGVLVIDLGGIHNRLDVTIDFAANTVTYSEETTFDSDNTTGSYNDSNFTTTQKLFTDSEGTGLINMTRDAFAADEDHEMSVFYLERGKGTSNCQIKFNLPMNDTVLVTKDATQSWSESNQDDADEGVDPLTDAEQAIVNNINFGFTLYQKNADETAFSTVANTNFYLLDSTGDVESINSTDANGHFYLKNGQTAKFITDISTEGVTYYVVEDTVPDGFVTPDFNYDGVAASGFDYNTGDGTITHVNAGNAIPEQEIATDATINKSYEVTVKGSAEANDSIEFICSNFLNAELPNPSAFAYEDIIVIDYGLPVQIDPLANDVFRGDSIEIVYVGGDNVTLNEIETEGEVTTATWTEDNTYDFGTVTLNGVSYAISGEGENATVTRDTLTYTLNKQLTEVEVLTYIIAVTGSDTQDATGEELYQYDYAIGKIYIVPATTMYYEENFSDLVTFTGSGWNGVVTDDANSVSASQEPGVVGTTTDSTYGSDVAYLSDSKDSNGTHYYGDTTKGAIKFSYTFTGTGTSFFARTSANTGYMQVKLYEGTEISSENMINLTYRDTYYNDTNESSEDTSGTLYNIPVYTEADLHYGTYTVVATIAKAGTAAAGGADGSGNAFYLDGIRIMEPLNELVDEKTGEPLIGQELLDKALGAYATDGEANMDVVTLRQKMITDAELATTPWNFVVMTDTNGEIKTAEDYVSIGPKEEVYLEKGQSVSFSLKYWETDGLMLYMGMKAPFGSAGVQVGQSTYSLKNATDCYYDITSNYSSLVTKYEQATDEEGNLLYTGADGSEVYEDAEGNLKYVSDNSTVAADMVLTPVDDTDNPYYVATFTLTATDKIVSLTNIKVTGNYEFTIIEDINVDVN